MSRQPGCRALTGGGRCNQRHGWSARGNRREGVVTRARRSRTSPNTQNPRAEARMCRPARGGARESRQKRTIPTPPQGCAAGDAVQTPGKGATGEGRLTQSPRGRFNDRERVLRRHRATKNAPRRLASTPARARPPKGCAWRDPNAHPRARMEIREWFEDRETPIVRRSRRENDDVGTRAYLRGSFGREMHGPGRFVRRGMSARTAQANPSKRTIFVSFLMRQIRQM